MHLSVQTRSLHEKMHLMGVKLTFIVYDLLLIHRPDWWLAPNPDIFKEWLQNICSVGDNLICISQAVSEELRDWIKQNPPTRTNDGPVVTSFHLGADVDNSIPSHGIPDDADEVLKEIQKRPSFLMVGTIEPRKGHSQTLAAFEQQWAKGVDINLVIIGKEGWLVDTLIDKLCKHPELGRRLFWLEGVSDEYLEKIYTITSCLIAASEGEGFGLPLIEAAQHKLPIIARDIPVFNEVAGKHAFYFDGKEPEELAITIQNWLKLYKLNQHPSSNSMPWLTWKKSTEQLCKLLDLGVPK